MGLIRKVFKATIGGSIILLGVVMLVTPGPGIVTILIGLSILASEFPTARRILNRLKGKSPGTGQ